MTYKDATHKQMMDWYAKYGGKQTLQKAHDVFHSQKYADNVKFKQAIHGEICECVLEILIRDEIKRNSSARDWLFCKGTVLKDRVHIQKNFFTEIDFMLFTTECVYIFECKSYAGNKELIGQGILKRDSGNGFDVYKQSLLHKGVLEPWLDGFTLKGRTPLVQMCMFNFSNGELVDKRSRAAKQEMPCLTEDTLISYLRNPGEAVWDMDCMKHVKEAFDKNSEILRQHHLNYVKGLHSK